MAAMLAARCHHDSFGTEACLPQRLLCQGAVAGRDEVSYPHGLVLQPRPGRGSPD